MTSRYAAPADGCRRNAAVLSLLATLAVPLATAAQPIDPVDLSWDAPASCPAEAEVRARIRALAGTTSSAGSQLKAAAAITRLRNGRYQLKLVVTLENLVGERELEARSCADLAGATAVNIALLLKDAEPSAAEASVRAVSPQASPTDTSKAEAMPDAPSARDESQTSDPNAWRGLLQVPRLAFSLGPMPAPSFGVSLAGGLARDAWSVVAGATLWLQHALASDRPDAAAKVDHVELSLHVCRAFPVGRFALAPCLSSSLEHVWARGVGPYVRTATGDATWLAAGAGVQARFPLVGWLNVLGGVEVKLQTARPRISIDGAGRIAQLGLVVAELSIGTEWIL